MARKRMISPEFFTSRTLNELPIPTMMTFVGLWCYVDDFGRGEDDTTMVKAAIWPRRKSHSEKKIEADLKSLDQAVVICRYEVGGFPLLHVTGWHEHQKISHRAPSKLPPCRHHEPGLWAEFMREDDPTREKFRRRSGVAPEEFRSDSTPIELKRREEKLSVAADACAHGFADVSECEMCQRKAKRPDEIGATS